MMTNLGITEAISSQAELLHAYRFVRLVERGDIKVPIQITGIRDEALKARSHLDRIRAAYAKFNEAAPAHASDVEGLADQIGSMQSDLEFAANVLGNSPGGGVVDKQVISSADVNSAPQALEIDKSGIVYPITLNPHRP